MRRQNFMGKVSLVIDAIRKKQVLRLGEACLILNVSAGTIIRYYLPAILEAEDIRWNGKQFETVVINNPLDTRQRGMRDFV